MKAFLIKYLPCTNTKPVRLKVSYQQNGSRTYSRDSLNPNCESQSIERQAVNQFCLDEGLTVNDFTIGQIENGLHCAVWNVKKGAKN